MKSYDLLMLLGAGIICISAFCYLFWRETEGLFGYGVGLIASAILVKVSLKSDSNTPTPIQEQPTLKEK